MDDDIVKRLRVQANRRSGCAHMMSDGSIKWRPMLDDAADEIERLRAELAAERDHHADALEMNNLLQKDKAELRAELATAIQDAEDLNVEVEHYANLAIVDLGANPTVSWNERAEAAEAELDALRALLREAREYTGYAFYGDRIEADHATDLCARIDSALNKGGEDE